jgi:myosin heavy subunit
MEGIQWKQIAYSDNRDCLDLLQDKKIGLFALLDDACRMPKPSDEAFLQRVYDEQLRKSKRLSQPKPGKASGFVHSAKEAFVVEHFAGQVCYAIAGFIDKNTDALTVDCELALVQSTHPLVHATFNAPAEPAKLEKASTSRGSVREGGRDSGREGRSGLGLGGLGGGGGRGKSSKKVTVSSAYMAQMAALHEDLVSCAPHFIRCIKTNRMSTANAFDGAYVLMQLRCSGMMEALELMQAGYPTRAPYKELASRYRPLMPPSVAALADSTFVEAILEALEMGRHLFVHVPQRAPTAQRAFSLPWPSAFAAFATAVAGHAPRR